jgi:pre-rRNA-processing protein TSR3
MFDQPRITVYHASQCDPKRCTALKLRAHGFVRIVQKIRYLPKRAIVLNPLAEFAFAPSDRERILNHGLAALDCSWNHCEKILHSHVKGTARCLPVLFAGNPVNFAKPTRLTTAEALAAALYIAGFKSEAIELLSLFTWGHTFLELNSKLLEAYSNASNSAEVVQIQNRINNLILGSETKKGVDMLKTNSTATSLNNLHVGPSMEKQLPLSEHPYYYGVYVATK